MSREIFLIFATCKYSWILKLRPFFEICEKTHSEMVNPWSLYRVAFWPFQTILRIFAFLSSGCGCVCVCVWGGGGGVRLSLFQGKAWRGGSHRYRSIKGIRCEVDCQLTANKIIRILPSQKFYHDNTEILRSFPTSPRDKYWPVPIFLPKSLVFVLFSSNWLNSNKTFSLTVY